MKKILPACLLATSQLGAAADGEQCIRLAGLEYERADLLSRNFRDDLSRARVGACIDSAMSRDILGAISNYFISRGLVTTRPYLLEQDVSDGWLRISILPGTVEAVIDADSGESSAALRGAFLFNGELLNLRELETSLEMIERPGSVDADFEIRPGSTPGASVIAVSSERSGPLRVELGANAQTDLDSQLGLQAVLDNPLRFNDVLELSVNRGEALQSYQSNRSEELRYSFALGAYLVELRHSDFSFEQRVQGLNDSFVSDGESVADRLRVSRVLSRGRSSRATLALSLELKATQNFFENEPVDVSSYKTSQAQLELRGEWFGELGSISAYYLFHRGLDSYGARDDDYYVREDGAENQARLQFEKHALGGRLLRSLGESAWQLESSLHLQLSDDLLFDGDKLNLGSPYTVRGYSSALSGGNAGYLRVDLVRRFASPGAAVDGGADSRRASLSIGFDYGEAKCEADNRDSCGEIYGAGLGFAVSDANFSASLLWGHPLKQKGDGIGDGNRWLLDLRWAL